MLYYAFTQNTVTVQQKVLLSVASNLLSHEQAHVNYTYTTQEWQI